MRALQVLTLAAFAIAARADVQPCQLTFLGAGVTCTEGDLTFSLASNAPADTIVAPISGGLALIGPMDGSGSPGTFIDLTVTVPDYFAIVGIVTVHETADILVAPNAPKVSGITSTFDGFQKDGNPTVHQIDFINANEYVSSCLACGVTSVFSLFDDPFLENGPTATLVLRTQTWGDEATTTRWDIGGFYAISPEPSTVILFTTALGLVWLAHRRVHALSPDHSRVR